MKKKDFFLKPGYLWQEYWFLPPNHCLDKWKPSKKELIFLADMSVKGGGGNTLVNFCWDGEKLLIFFSKKLTFLLIYPLRRPRRGAKGLSRHIRYECKFLLDDFPNLTKRWRKKISKTSYQPKMLWQIILEASI